MPFKSEKQRRYLWMKEPKVAARWSRKYGSEPVQNGNQNNMGQLPKKGMPPFMKNKQNQVDPKTEARKGAAAKRLAVLKAKQKGK